MRHLATIVSLLVLTACNAEDELKAAAGNSEKVTASRSGGAACSNSLILGDWENTELSGDYMTFYDDCSGYDSYCGSVFTVPEVNEFEGYVVLDVVSSPGVTGCLPEGQWACYFILEGNLIGFDCGFGPAVYEAVN